MIDEMKQKGAGSNDLWHLQASFETEEVNLTADILAENKNDFISSGAVNLSGNKFDYKKALLVRDADGHAVRVIER